jgi:hypothetical protein
LLARTRRTFIRFLGSTRFARRNQSRPISLKPS